MLSFANAVLLYFILPETVKKDSFDANKVRKNRFVELFESLKDSRFGTLTAVYFFLVTSFSIMTYAFVLYTIQRFGYDAEQNGYIFAFIGALAVIFQGGLFGKLVKRFGENPLMITGCLMMTASLFLTPFISPETGGLIRSALQRRAARHRKFDGGARRHESRFKSLRRTRTGQSARRFAVGREFSARHRSGGRRRFA